MVSCECDGIIENWALGRTHKNASLVSEFGMYMGL